MYSVCLYSYTARVCAFVYVHVCTCTVHEYPNYLRCGIFLLLVALLDTCTNMIRLGIVIKYEKRQVNVKFLHIRMWNIGMAKETRLECLVHIVQ